MKALEQALERFNAWAQRHETDLWFRMLDHIGRWGQVFLIVAFAVIGASIAGYAIAHSWWGLLFAIPVGVGALMLLHHGLGEDDDA